MKAKTYVLAEATNLVAFLTVLIVSQLDFINQELDTKLPLKQQN